MPRLYARAVLQRKSTQSTLALCYGERAQVIQNQPLVHTLSRILKRVPIPPLVENEELFTADRSLKVGLVILGGYSEMSRLKSIEIRR